MTSCSTLPIKTSHFARLLAVPFCLLDGILPDSWITWVSQIFRLTQLIFLLVLSFRGFPQEATDSKTCGTWVNNHLYEIHAHTKTHTRFGRKKTCGFSSACPNVVFSLVLTPCNCSGRQFLVPRELQQLPPTQRKFEGKITLPWCTFPQLSGFDCFETVNELEQLIKMSKQRKEWQDARVKGQRESPWSLTMLMLQISIPLPRYLNWLLPNPPSPLGQDPLSSGCMEQSHKPKVSGRPLTDSVIISEMRGMLHASALLNFSLCLKQWWQTALNSPAKSHQLLRIS